MESIINIAFSPVNITLSILVILLIIYWLFTIISGIDFDLDVDVDIEVDTDIDIDADVDMSHSMEGGNIDFHDIANTEVNKETIVSNRRKKLKWWQIVLLYFNFVGLPFMFTFTCWIFIWWLATVIATSITYSYNNMLGYILFLIGILPSLFLTKIVTTPFKSFFKNLNQDGDTPIDLVGRKGTLFSTISGDKMGSAEVNAEGAVMSIYVKSLNGEQINYNQTILVIKPSNNKNYYYVKSYENLY